MKCFLLEGLNDCKLITASPTMAQDTTVSAMDYLRQHLAWIENGQKRITMVVCLSSPDPSDREFSQAITYPKAVYENTRLILIGMGRATSSPLAVEPETQYFETIEAFISNFRNLEFNNEIILLTGADITQVSAITNKLKVGRNSAIMEVDLGAVKHNLEVYKTFLKAETQIMVMVKANAYGSGGLVVSKFLEYQKVDYLGVAYAEEGIELRKAGIRKPIMVINPGDNDFSEMCKHNLEPEIYSLKILKSYLNFRKEITCCDENCSPVIHLKLETGMNRLGIGPFELKAALDLLRSYHEEVGLESFKTVRIGSVLSHLAGSESQRHDEYTISQIQRFNEMYKSICVQIGYRPTRHILNSSGILRFPQFQMEMVRLGLGIYGSDESGSVHHLLRPVNTLKGIISQIKNMNPGETIGYDRAAYCETRMRIAIINLGYADGLLRKAGNGRFSVLINNHRAKIIGRVCMDMTMVDISHIPDAKEGDEVIVFGVSEDGSQNSAGDFAAALETIPYEVFTSVSKRVRRIYKLP
jgi:alanine racemase